MHSGGTPSHIPPQGRVEDGTPKGPLISRDETFAGTLATFISNIARGNVPSVTADNLASATLVALLKKSEEDTHALRDLLGPSFALPIRPLTMARVFVKLACKCTLSSMKDDIADDTGPI